MESTSQFNRYAFRNSSDEATIQLSQLEAFLDDNTTGSLDRVGIQPGFRCLELGPGRGSVSHWMADRVGDTGQVTAIDINPVHIPPHDNLEVRQHDIREGLGEDGPFDVIHARLVLSHITQRHGIVKSLVDLLRPGGWLVVGEFVRDQPRVLVAETDEDAAIFVKVSEAIYDGLTQIHGADLRFGHDVFGRMVECGLEEVRNTEYAESWSGGDGGGRFLFSNSHQLEKIILSSGVSEEELAEYRRVVSESGLTVKSQLFVNTVGQKPTASQ